MNYEFVIVKKMSLKLLLNYVMLKKWVLYVPFFSWCLLTDPIPIVVA